MDVTSETDLRAARRRDMEAWLVGPTATGTIALELLGWVKILAASAIAVGRMFVRSVGTDFEASVVSALGFVAGCACLAVASMRRQEIRKR